MIIWECNFIVSLQLDSDNDGYDASDKEHTANTVPCGLFSCLPNLQCVGCVVGVELGVLGLASLWSCQLKGRTKRAIGAIHTLCHSPHTPSRQLVQRRLGSRASTPELSWCWCGWWRLIHWQQKVPVSTEQDPSGSESGGASDHPNTHSESLLNRCHPQRARKRPRGRRLAGRCQWRDRWARRTGKNIEQLNQNKGAYDHNKGPHLSLAPRVTWSP